MTYTSEAVLPNVALLGQTARRWRDENPGFDGDLDMNWTTGLGSGSQSCAVERKN